jgi:hypothetical protein
MNHVRTIADLDDLPEIRIFYCAPCAHVETIKLKTPVPDVVPELEGNAGHATKLRYD